MIFFRNIKREIKRDTEVIPRLAVYLGKDRIGKIILSEHKIFEGYMLSLWHQKVQSQNIDYVLSYITGEGVGINKSTLKDKFVEFEKLYLQLVEEYLDTNINYDKLIGNLTILVNEAISLKDFEKAEWKSSTFKRIPKILAYIFSIWTLLNSSNFFDSKASDKKSYLFKPHPAQIISIFRMLGIGDDKEQLDRNLLKLKQAKENQ